MAYNHMYMGQGRPEDYNAFNNVAIQATVSSYFPAQGRVIPQRFDDPNARDMNTFQRETIQLQREDLQWDSKYTNMNENMKYTQMNESPKYVNVSVGEHPKYIHMNESPKYVHIGQSPKYIQLNENVKYGSLTDSVPYSPVKETGKYPGITVPDTTNFMPMHDSSQFTSLGEQQTVSRAKEAAPKRLHECNLCGRALSSAGALKTHMLSHSDEKPFVCHICDKRFASSTGHQRHVICHAGIRQYKCETCDKTFVLKTALRQHEKIHEGLKKPYKCEICHCSFRFPFRLKEHQRIHTGERPFVCNTCGKSFRVNRLLAKHKDVHTGKVKKYNTCYKRTKPTPKECPICQQMFSDIKQHLETHNSLRCYKCHICDKKFKRRSYAQTHMRRAHAHKSSLSAVEEIDAEEAEDSMSNVQDSAQELDKTFQCDVCSRMFALEWSRTMHRTLVHKL